MPREDIPEELVEIAARSIAKTRDPRAEWEKHWTPASRAEFREGARAVLSAVSEAGWVRGEEGERWRDAWRARGRRINGVGEFAEVGPWWPPEERAKVVAERDEARAQAEALAEEADGLLKALQEIVDHEGEPGYDPLRIASKAIGDLYEARSSRSSQESSDAKETGDVR